MQRQSKSILEIIRLHVLEHIIINIAKIIRSGFLLSISSPIKGSIQLANTIHMGQELAVGRKSHFEIDTYVDKANSHHK